MNKTGGSVRTSHRSSICRIIEMGVLLCIVQLIEITLVYGQSDPSLPKHPDAVRDHIPITGQPNEPVRIWRQQHPNDSRTDDQITVDLARENPLAFNTYGDAIADYRRILTNEFALFSQGTRRYRPDNPVHVWLLGLVNEQERAVQARGLWNPSELFRNGKTFLPREEYVPLMKTNPAAAASNYWTLSNDEMLQRLGRISGVPLLPQVVSDTVPVEVPSKVTKSVEDELVKVRLLTAPNASGAEVLYKLGAVRVTATVEEPASELVSTSDIIDRFKQTLRNRSIDIDDNARFGIMVSVGGNWVRPDLVVFAYQCRSQVFDSVVLSRSDDIRRAAVAVWDKDRGGAVSRSLSRRALLDETQQLADKFADDYLRANSGHQDNTGQ